MENPITMLERRNGRGSARGRTRIFWDIVFVLVRWIARRAQNVYATFGLFLLVGATLAIGLTIAFAKFASRVVSGRTQAFDDAVMTFIGNHQYPAVTSVMLEITMLGTGTVVMTMALIAAVFLWLNAHKHSATLLAIATGGGVVLNGLLKAGFDRPRPHIFEWGTNAVSSSFPSGHAMSAAIVYGTVAYLAARLQKRAASRMLTMVLAALMIVLICASRLYLGVHYPSDVLAGVTIGLAWAAFCMATLEAIQLYARRNAPQMLRSERPSATMAPSAAGAVVAGLEAGESDAEAEGSASR